MATITNTHTEVKSEYDLRDSVLNALNEVYASDYAGKDWYVCKFSKEQNFALEMNLQLVTDILALVVFSTIDPENDVRQKYYGKTLFNRILYMIWNTYSGGTTAEYATEKVCAILNISKEK